MRRILPLVIALLAAACSPSNAMTHSTSGTTMVTVADSTTTTSAASSAAAEMFVDTTAPVPFQLTSPAFGDGETIPAEHTCDGADVSPALSVVGLPSETKSVVVTMEDPDAALGTWVHWVVFDMAAQPSDLKVPAGAEGRGTSGINSWSVNGYKGPCPPEGEEHRYFFTVYALDERLELPVEVDAAGVRTAMQPYLISSAELMGRYAR